VGTIYYGGSDTPIHIEDRALAHLKVVIATKLRRSESFTVSWQHGEDQRGRSTIWLHPSIPLRFVFDEPDPPELNRQWIEQLAHSANSTQGIQLSAEIVDPPVDSTIDGGTGAESEATLSLGAVEVTELDIGALTVAGKKLTTDP
jgi:hypothetical protein